MSLNENAIHRVSVSLGIKEDEFYTNLVIPLKNNRELSSFIVKMMKLYYYDASVRQKADEFMHENSSLMVLQKQLERIALAHAKAINSTSAIKSTILNNEDDVVPIDRLAELEKRMQMLAETNASLVEKVETLQAEPKALPVVKIIEPIEDTISVETEVETEVAIEVKTDVETNVTPVQEIVEVIESISNDTLQEDVEEDIWGDIGSLDLNGALDLSSIIPIQKLEKNEIATLLIKTSEEVSHLPDEEKPVAVSSMFKKIANSIDKGDLR